MSKGCTNITAALVVVAAITGLNARLLAATVEMWPSERRSNNTLFCYGDDWNSILIQLEFNDYGKHRIELPESFLEPTVLDVCIPRSVEFLGADVMGRTNVNKDFIVTELAQDDKAYKSIRIPLVNDYLSERLIRSHTFYDVFIWHKPPKQLDDTVSWELRYGDKTMAKGSSRLVVAGVVVAGRKMPKRFGFYPYGWHRTVPENDYDKMADFDSRFGISGIAAIWTRGLPNRGGNEYKMFEANRRHGVKNMANMTMFAGKHGGIYGATPEATMKLGGLVKAMDKVCAGLESEAARNDWKQAHAFFDLAFWDWEPIGPRAWPGYEDRATIAAFAEKNGLNENLTPELLKTKYRDQYSRYRMEQIARPLYSMKKTIDFVKPMPFRVEQGDGPSCHIDYDVYGHDYDALSPMIYCPSPIGYARSLIETLTNTSVPAKKFWPDITIGWPGHESPVFREFSQECLMDTMVTAAAGCGSISHWPGIPEADAAWFGIHEGLARIALVEDFYFDGKPVDTISMKGIPYREKKISLGQKTLDLSAPEWRAALVLFTHKLKEEFLLTLLNYHTAEDAFISVSAPVLRKGFLVNPVDRVYQVFDDAGSAIVRVGRETPGLWIATADKMRIADFRLIEADTVKAEFDKARETFLKASKKGAVQLGAVGDINIAYALTMFAGEERATLQVKTPAQTLSFGPSGGRVYDWAASDMPDFVGRKNFTTGGFGMDLLWLPSGARWSGDETQELDLIECSNDGIAARVVYGGMFRKGFPGIRLRKTYSILAAGTSLDVEITLFNEHATPVTLAYWSHNVMALEQTHFIGRDLRHATEKGKATIFPAEDLPEEFKAQLLMPDSIIGASGPIYAEFFPDSKAGLIFRLPENFMNIYRWSSIAEADCGSEWMSQPLSMPAGTSRTLRFSIAAVTNATPDSLREMLK